MADSPPKSDPMPVQPEHQRPDRARRDALVRDVLSKLEDFGDSELYACLSAWYEMTDAACEKLEDRFEKELLQAEKEAMKAWVGAYEAKKKAHVKASVAALKAALRGKNSIASEIMENL